jgi:Sulfatase-modifying factor enzyme 1
MLFSMRFEASTFRRLLVRPGYAQPAAYPWLAPCSSRVLRGGSWNNNPQNLRSANRNRNNPTNRNNNRGFRLASTLTGRMAAFTGADSDHELRPGPAMTIKRRSGSGVVGAPPSCRAFEPGRRAPLHLASNCGIDRL